MREHDPQREQMGRLLQSGKVRGFLTIHALLTEDNEVHVFPDAENIDEDKAIQACKLGIEYLFEKGAEQ